MIVFLLDAALLELLRRHGAASHGFFESSDLLLQSSIFDSQGFGVTLLPLLSEVEVEVFFYVRNFYPFRTVLF